jgi:hypothetical protein
MRRRSLHVLTSGSRAELQEEVDEALREIAGHVRRREQLRRQGASERELERYRQEIGRLRWRLAHAARASATEEGPTAA